MNQEQVLGIVRHILTAAGGVLVTKGYVDANTLATIVGALATLIGAGWSIWIKKPAQ